MTPLLERAAALFVTPAGAEAEAAGAMVGSEAAAGRRAARRARDEARGVAVRASVLVLGGAESGDAAVAVGRGLARAGRAAFALVCVRGAPVAERPAMPRAAAAAGRLRARGHDARARGRVVVVALAGDEHEALAEAARAAAACAAGAAPVPLVLALAGPRSGAVEERFLEHDVVLLTETGDAPSDVARVAVARLRAAHPRLAVATHALPAPVGPLRPGARAVARVVLDLLG